MTYRNLPAIVLAAAACLLAACAGGDGPEAAPVVAPPPPVVTPAKRIHPTLSVQAATGGSFVGDADFSIGGDAVKGTGTLSALTIGGESAAFSPEGRFEHAVRSAPGINIVPVKIEADDRGRAVEAVSVMGGDVHAPGAILEHAMLIHLGQELLDDDDDDIDDIARVVEILLVDAGFQAWLSEAEFGEGGTTSVERFEAERSKVDFRAVEQPNGDGCLSTAVTIGDSTLAEDPGFTLELKLSGAAALLGEDVMITGKQATISGDLCPRIGVDGTIVTEVLTPEVDIVDMVFSTDVYPNMEDALPSTHEAIKDLATGFLGDALGKALGTLMGEFLGSFEFELTIWEAPAITAKFALESVTITQGAVALSLSHEPGVTFGLPTAPPGAGSFATADPGPTTRLSSRPLAIAMSDDLANQMLFSFWWAGIVSNLGFADLLVGKDTSSLPKVFQPLTGVSIDMGLPPTLMTAEQRDFPFDMALGELTLTLDVGTEKHFNCSLHIRAGVDLSGGDDGQIHLRMDNRARKITIAAAVRELPPGLDPGDIAALLQLVFPALLGQTNAVLPGLSIPNVNLANLPVLSEVSEFSGKVMALTSPDVKRTGDGGGYVVFEGGVTLKDAPPAPPVRE